MKPSRPPRHRVVCPTTKVWYPSEQAASEALDRISDDPYVYRKRSKPVRVYRCQHCGGWHLTSQTTHG